MADEPITLAAIAKQAGVSQPTVSKVLNGRADVAATTRARVEKVLLEVGYQRRRRPAHGEAPQYTAIDLALPLVNGPWADGIVHGVVTAARSLGATISVFELGEDSAQTGAWLESAIARRPSAAILAFTTLSSAHRKQLKARGIPWVVIDPVADDLDDIPSVGSSNFQGGRSAARHLLDLGHTRIGVIGGPSEVLACRARVAGFNDALHTRHVSADPALVGFTSLDVQGGFEQAQRLLALPDPPTAIFASSDLQALGVYRAAAACGLSVPNDLSVIGYDGLPICDWVSPELTSVAQPLAAMTARATAVAVDLAGGMNTHHTHVDLAVDLVVRRSTAPPNR